MKVKDAPEGKPIKGLVHIPATQCVAYDIESDQYHFWVKGGSKVVSFPAAEYDQHLRSARRAAYGDKGPGE